MRCFRAAVTRTGTVEPEGWKLFRPVSGGSMRKENHIRIERRMKFWNGGQSLECGIEVAGVTEIEKAWRDCCNGSRIFTCFKIFSKNDRLRGSGYQRRRRVPNELR